jgi:hypothetical protein
VGGGEILDPENGKTYRATLKLVDGGRRLVVRGYIGLPPSVARKRGCDEPCRSRSSSASEAAEALAVRHCGHALRKF